MNDPYHLERFVRAQNPILDDVEEDLRRGLKTGHWIWFVFPQLRGLGRSAMAWDFGISGRGEAAAYLAHAVLGPRLLAWTRLVLAVEGRSSEEIFGEVDAMKFRSSMTLFREVAGNTPEFASALRKYYDGPDTLTLNLLKRVG